ncbi:MAG: hydrogenase [Desulfuromonas sp.]|uniref:nitrogen fixation protein NifQ n=1 Tax=Desulfuromonas sp. TaxID=892 RepID=UPI000CC5E747|nr:nitrogen fixation protein NifQ [Desulfuromonas sp.]PLX82276.1 MAG: hydrogenase [Desulfuromonas sp.]
MAGYTDIIRRYATDDSRAGALPDAHGTGEVGLEAGEAGTRLAVRFAIRVEGGAVVDIRFQVFGCGFTVAACAALAELAEGHPLAEVDAIAPAWVDAVLGGLPEERAYCAELAAEALRGAVKSASGGDAVRSSVAAGAGDHAPRLSPSDPVYRQLMESPAPVGAAGEDRHLFACLIAVAAGEPSGLPAALGLEQEGVTAVMETYFPGADPDALFQHATPARGVPPETNGDVLAILLSHVPQDAQGRDLPASALLARILAARAAHPGHLWRAMGLFERPELSAAIARHLPTLAEANDRGMRWKRFLFKEACDLGGGTMCKSPDCGACSDYALCFAPD